MIFNQILRLMGLRATHGSLAVPRGRSIGGDRARGPALAHLPVKRPGSGPRYGHGFRLRFAENTAAGVENHVIDPHGLQPASKGRGIAYGVRSHPF